MDTNIEHIIKVDEIIHSIGALQALKRKLQDGERDPEKLGEACDRIVAATQKVISEFGEKGRLSPSCCATPFQTLSTSSWKSTTLTTISISAHSSQTATGSGLLLTEPAMTKPVVRRLWRVGL